MSLSGQVVIRPGLTLTRTRSGGTQTWVTPFGATGVSYADGTGSAQINRLYDTQHTLGSSATVNLDLAGGSLLDAFEQAITFVKVKVLYFKAASANVHNVEVGPGASNGFLGPFKDASDRLVLAPGVSWSIAHPTDGWTVTAATGDIFSLINTGATAGQVVDVLFGGTDA